MADRVVVCAPAVAGIAGVDVLGSMGEMTDGTGTSVDAAMGAGIGSAAGSRIRRAPRGAGLAKPREAARVPTGDPD
jgi:hypothetical protein